MKNKSNKKLSFSKIAVALMYIMVIGFFVLISITEQYPPAEFIIAWMGFWCVQAIVTAVLEINKRGHKNQITLLDAILPYVNEENASAIISKYLGIDPKYETSKKIKDIENRRTTK